MRMSLFRKFTVPFIGLLMALMLVDCGVEMVTSLYPIYTKNTLVQDQNLEGQWQTEGEGYNIVLSFSRSGKRGYLMHYRLSSIYGETLLEVPFTAHLALIGESIFIDIYSEDGYQRERLLIKKDDEVFDEAVKKATRYGIGVEAELKELKGGTFLINNLREDSTAVISGLRNGDRVFKVNGHSIEGLDKDELSKYTLGPPGSRVTFTILREGVANPMEFTFTRDTRIANPLKDGRGEILYGPDPWPYYFDKALTVKRVHEGGPAAKIGIRSGDRITMINGRSLEWLDKYEAPAQLLGPKGSQIEIAVLHRSASELVTYSLTRDWPPGKSERQKFDPSVAMVSLIEKKGPYAKLYDRHWLGSHVFVRTIIEKDHLSFVPLNGERFFDLLRDQPDILSAADSVGGEVKVLSSPPEELHRFLLQYGGNREVFPDSGTVVFTRVKESQK